MSLLRTAMRAGIAKKVWDEARKPQNQAKAKELFAKLTNKDEPSGRGTRTSRSARSTRRR